MSKANNYFQRQRIGLAVVGGIMTLMVAFSLTPTFAGVVATITNSVNTASTGTLVMEELKNLDKVAYIRFASVYLSFDNINEFSQEIENLKDH